MSAVRALETFTGSALTQRIASLEDMFTDSTASSAGTLLTQAQVTRELLASAYVLKQAAGQIHVIVHVIDILLALPHILDPDEKVECLSLGAGNTGKPFDLETNSRVAEFKFIHWQTKSNVIRQNGLFKDLYQLAEYPTTKRKFMYVLDTAQPLKFLNGRRALRSIMSRHRPLWESFQATYGEKYTRVREYYAIKRDLVNVVGMSDILGELLPIVSCGQEGRTINRAPAA